MNLADTQATIHAELVRFNSGRPRRRRAELDPEKLNRLVGIAYGCRKFGKSGDSAFFAMRDEFGVGWRTPQQLLLWLAWSLWGRALVEWIITRVWELVT